MRPTRHATPTADAHRWVAQMQKLSQPLDSRQGTEQAVICFGKCLATQTDKTLCAVYALIAIIALVATWSNNIGFMRQPENRDVLSWYRALYANQAAASFTNDLLMLALAGCIFMVIEARRLKMRFVWIYILLSGLVAISVMFPLFLIARQITISKLRVQQSTLESASIAGSSR